MSTAATFATGDVRARLSHSQCNIADDSDMNTKSCLRVLMRDTAMTGDQQGRSGLQLRGAIVMAFASPLQVGVRIVKSIRPDLNGRRLINEEKTQTWLVFNGLRHYVTSAQVYDALFRPGVNFDHLPDLDSVAEGPDLSPGTCLVSDSETGEIYLIFGDPSINIRKYAIKTYENFVELGLNEAVVRTVPPIVLAAIPAGRPIHFTMPSS
ncbi:hypothetical protein ACQVP2_23925 [Methylobacterium aquaticum]|uniref:hypothetical protein n=1 Tax=Methylobacterium aquaticum TaxID=270351 RepID=UPI003D165955